MVKKGSTIDPVFAATNAAYLALKDLAPDDLRMALNFLAERFGTTVAAVTQKSSGTSTDSGAASESGGVPTPKEFMQQKRPRKHIERIAALAYYLTRFRDVASFATKDLTALNEEARQPKFTSATVHVDNATKADYLTSSGRGLKAITSRGEALVDALPDPVKVKAVLEENVRVTKRRKKKRKP